MVEAGSDGDLDSVSRSVDNCREEESKTHPCQAYGNRRIERLLLDSLSTKNIPWSNVMTMHQPIGP